jgi:hypothetical protein
VVQCELFERDDGAAVLVGVPGSHLRGTCGLRRYYHVGTAVIEPETLEPATLMQLQVLGHAQICGPQRLRVLTCITKWAFHAAADAYAVGPSGATSRDEQDID